MLSAQNPTLGTLGATLDPNLGRVIEETIGVVNDVETRLQALKIGISQAIPQLAPALLWREAALASLASRQTPFASLYANPNVPFAHYPTSGFPTNVPSAYGMVPSIPTAFAGVPTSPMGFGSHVSLNPQPIPPGIMPTAPSLFGSPFGLGIQAGVTNPFGIVSPFRLY